MTAIIDQIYEEIHAVLPQLVDESFTHVGEDWDYENTPMEYIFAWLMQRVEQRMTEHIAMEFFDHDVEKIDECRSEGMLASDIDVLISPYIVDDEGRQRV